MRVCTFMYALMPFKKISGDDIATWTDHEHDRTIEPTCTNDRPVITNRQDYIAIIAKHQYEWANFSLPLLDNAHIPSADQTTLDLMVVNMLCSPNFNHSNLPNSDNLARNLDSVFGCAPSPDLFHTLTFTLTSQTSTTLLLLGNNEWTFGHAGSSELDSPWARGELPREGWDCIFDGRTLAIHELQNEAGCLCVVLWPPPGREEAKDPPCRGGEWHQDTQWKKGRCMVYYEPHTEEQFLHPWTNEPWSHENPMAWVWTSQIRDTMVTTAWQGSENPTTTAPCLYWVHTTWDGETTICEFKRLEPICIWNIKFVWLLSIWLQQKS